MKKILLSLTLIGLLGSGAVAATRAYFSESAVLGANTFTTGTLNIDVSEGTSTTSVSFDKMEPGKVYPKYLIVKNVGDFDLKWKAYISGGNGGKLFQVLKVDKVIMNPPEYSPNPESGFVKSGPDNFQLNNTPITFSSLTNSDNPPLKWVKDGGVTKDAFEPNWSAVYRLDIMVDPAAGNEYMGQNWSGDLTIYATQDSNPDWN